MRPCAEENRSALNVDPLRGKSEILISKYETNSKSKVSNVPDCFGHSNFGNSILFGISNLVLRIFGRMGPVCVPTRKALALLTA